jgi:uncharacterized protein YdhG (YjbR/CyaY superfamily)
MRDKGSSAKSDAAADIDAYIALAPPEARAALEALRRVIRAAAPTATEAISYQMPTFKYDGKPLVAFAAWKNHCSLYPMSYAVIDAHARALEGYAIDKGTIRFPADRPLPVAVVKQVVQARIAELHAGTSL